MNAKTSAETIFGEAIEIPSPEDRAAYLDQVCANDPGLRGKVEKLVADHFRAGRFLEQPAAMANATLDHPLSISPGTQIGPYKLMEQIGEGGMGLVFVAEQHEPVRRKVALKLIKPGMDSREVIARFEAERQALALMDHPNIARVFDGGAVPLRIADCGLRIEDSTSAADLPSSNPQSAIRNPQSDGRPYFVMELVKGVPITQFCDDNRLTPRQRLELFTQVCHAVQHAHQKGIIHRDIKPNNVMVASHDGIPVVKVIDFGVAKAIGQQLSEGTIYTAFSQLVGTPLYMSPEQAGMSSLDIDTRTDIYSLGVLLYELLTGQTPFDKERLKQAAFDEMRRIIREEEPPKPSTRLSELSSHHAGRDEPGSVTRSVTTTLASIAAQRNTEPLKLTKLVRGELDWIVMKSLEKERNRRYETASALAADVQRYLADEPVQACPPSVRYRFQKFARKNKAALTTAALVAAALLIGTTVSVWQAVRATQAEAQARANELRAIASARAESAARQAEVVERRRSDERFKLAREAVQEMYSEMASQWLDDEPQLDELQKRFVLKTVAFYEKFADEQSADPSFRRSQGLEYINASAIHSKLGDEQQAEAALGKALAILMQLVDEFPANPEYRHWLAKVHERLGNRANDRPEGLAEAEQHHRQALALCQALLTDYPKHRESRSLHAGVVDALANDLKAMGRLSEAEQLYGRTLKLMEKLLKESPNDSEYQYGLACTLHNLALLRKGQNQLADARQLVEQAIKHQQRAVEARPRERSYTHYLARHYGLLALVLIALQLPEEAERALDKEFAYREKLGVDYPRTAVYKRELASNRYNLGYLLAKADRSDDAEAAYLRGVQALNELVADFPGTPFYQEQLAVQQYALGNLLKKARRYGEAEAAYRHCVQLLNELIGKFPDMFVSRRVMGGSLNNLSILLKRRGEWAEAIRLVERAIKHQQTALELKPEDKQAGQFLRNHFSTLAYLLANAPDAKLRDPVRAMEMANRTLELDPQDGYGHGALGMAQYRIGEWKASLASLEKGLELNKEVEEDGVRFFVAMAHWQLGDKKLARIAYDEAVKWTEENKPEDEALLRAFREEAEQLLRISR